jgi:hypothetical protein
MLQDNEYFIYLSGYIGYQLLAELPQMYWVLRLKPVSIISHSWGYGKSQYENSYLVRIPFVFVAENVSGFLAIIT